MNKALIDKLVNSVLAKQQMTPAPGIEQILNEAGVHGMPPHEMAEIRAQVYHRLQLRVSTPDALKQYLIYFMADYDVFRASELRYYFPGDKTQQLKVILEQLGYVSRHDIPGEQEPVWRPKFMQQHTIKNKLARPRIGDKAYFDYLFYQPPEPAAGH
ncbi:hypothetical protein [Thalassomonas haliotis]|uniref:Uncharacterized protein n=1 Tax=Thalassomonas haliotis TaxID=485448 RepID=A0ABY7VDY5_9GAMM|nr:hypothetical protein [Thalassomonas haliotis]WDE11758.1 hypothetical protein H3N35_26795 [Thalassomonas haliotis]